MKIAITMHDAKLEIEVPEELHDAFWVWLERAAESEPMLDCEDAGISTDEAVKINDVFDKIHRFVFVHDNQMPF